MGLVLGDDARKDVEGIAGWLLLPAIGLIVALARDTFEAISGVRALLTAPSLENLLPLLLVIPWVFFLCVATVFFFRKHRWTPYLYIAFLCGHIGFAALYLLGHIMEPGPDTADAPKEIARAIGGAGLWIPYFLMSRRVKATFVRSW